MTNDPTMDATARIVSAAIPNYDLDRDGLIELIQAVRAALVSDLSAVSKAIERPKSAVPVKESITADGITCLCCGKQFVTLKRHIRSEHNLTPEGYRELWGLEPDYPMTAPAYSVVRSRVAKQFKLGVRQETAAKASSQS